MENFNLSVELTNHIKDKKMILSEDLKVTIASSVITATALKDELGIDCKIKWVNDLYFNNKKVSGTLCEGLLKNTFGNKKNVIIVGIGINISTADFPDDISQKAGSVLDNDQISLKDDYKDRIIINLSNALFEFFIIMAPLSSKPSTIPRSITPVASLSSTSLFNTKELSK